jgi:ubiquitin-protein ligase
MQKSMGGNTYTVSAMKRIASDLKEIKKYPIEGVAVGENEDNIGKWSIFLEGPKVKKLSGPFCAFNVLTPLLC